MSAAVKGAEMAYKVYKMQRTFSKMKKKKPRGGVRDKLDKEPRNPAIPTKPGPRGTLHLTAVSARELKGGDAIGKSDPYCVVAIGSQSFKTKKISNTDTPVWNKDFKFEIDGDVFVSIKVFDKDVFKKDDLIGEVVLKVKYFVEEGLDDWFELDPCGLIRIKAHFVPDFVGELSITVLEARSLAKADISGKADPYCVIKVGGHEEKTKKVKRSLKPKWKNEKFTFMVRGDTFADVYVYDWDRASKDDIMGEVLVKSSTWDSGEVVDSWFDLLPEGQGAIRLQLKFEKFRLEVTDAGGSGEIEASSSSQSSQSSPSPSSASTAGNHENNVPPSLPSKNTHSNVAEKNATIVSSPPPPYVASPTRDVVVGDSALVTFSQYNVNMILSSGGKTKYMSHVDCRSSRWSHLTVENVQFSGSDLRGVAMVSVCMGSCIFTGTQLNNANMTDALFRNCTFADCDLTGCNLMGALFEECRISHVKVDGLIGFDECKIDGSKPKKDILKQWGK